MGRRGLMLAYVHAFRDRIGVMRHYFRRVGCPRTPLPGLPGSDEFMDAYRACLKQMPAVAAPKEQAPARSMRALGIAYFASPNFLSLSSGSQSIYRRTLEPFLREHGHRRADQLTRANIIAIMGKMADRPGAASMLLKRLRILVHFGIDLGWLRDDPTLRVKSYRSVELHTWTEAEIGQFEARWPIGTKQRLAFALLLYTGQRGSDVRRMRWSDIAGKRLRLMQQKTGTELSITLHPSLLAILRTTTRHPAAILMTDHGEPFSPKGIGNFMSAAIKAAGLPSRCKAHGLRKAAARRFAEAGCSTKQIGARTGHKSLAEIERYTRAAEQEMLAEQALEKQMAKERGKPKRGNTGKRK